MRAGDLVGQISQTAHNERSKTSNSRRFNKTYWLNRS